MKLTVKDKAVKVAYDSCKPDQFGHLHERMKYLIEMMHKHRSSIHHEVETAIYDLETEVKYTLPAMPPFGRRTIN
jgi:hypothetical protein